MFLSKHSTTKKYYVYWFTPDGKRRSKSTKTAIKKDALKFLSRLRKQIEEEKDREFIPISLKDFYFHYLRSVEPHFTDKTMKVHKTTYKFLLEHFGNIQLSELTTSKIEDYISERLREGSVYVARRDFSNLSAALNKAVRNGYLVKNPCQGIKRLRLPEKQPLFYTQEGFNELIKAIDDKDIRDLTIFAVNTGLRQMELITLEWRQINFNERLLTLDNRTHLTKGKRVHTLPINKKAMEVLIKRYENKNGLSNVFTYKGEVIRQDWFSKYFKKFVLAAGLNPKLNFHSLRHTFASWLVQKGVSIYTVSKLLGHQDISTTQIYSHLRSEDLRNAIDLL